jgi:hypothetical protein
MTNYICKRCGYNTKRKSDFQRHINRKFQCKEVKNNKDMVNIFKKINKENQSSIIVFINNSNHFLSSNEKMRKLQTENIILKEKISKLKDSISSIL